MHKHLDKYHIKQGRSQIQKKRSYFSIIRKRVQAVNKRTDISHYKVATLQKEIDIINRG